MLAAKPNVIHIQSGRLRGRKLTFPDRPGLRPATGEMRETLFNWLRPILNEMRVLDAFAGSGALGIEALSQGASYVKAYEIDEHAFNAIQNNLSSLPDLAYELVKGDFTENWQSLNNFNLILLDPPYASDLLEKSLTFLSNKINDDTIVFIHHPSHVTPCMKDWEIIKQKTRQKRHYALLKTKQKD